MDERKLILSSILIVSLVFYKFLFPSNQLVFYSQPASITNENFKFDTKEYSPDRKIISLIGEYQVIDPETGDQIGKVNIPSVFHSGKKITLRRIFDLEEKPINQMILHLKRANGYLEITLNEKLIFTGSKNFIPIQVAVSPETLRNKGNVLEIQIAPWNTTKNQLPMWTPLNLPRIDSGVAGSIFLEILPLTHIEFLEAYVGIEKSGSKIWGNLQISGNALPGMKSKVEIKLLRGKQLQNTTSIDVAFDSLKNNNKIHFEMKNLTLEAWSIEKPLRYHLNAILKIEGNTVDQVKRNIPLRNIHREGNQLYLNNKAIKLNGINYVYQDVQGRGLLNRHLVLEDLNLIKSHGFNAIRIGFFPQYEVILNLADSLGIICLQDLPFSFFKLGEGSGGTEINQPSHYLKDFLKIAGEHPSVLGLGFQNYYKKSSEEWKEAWLKMRRIIAEKHNIIFYACSFNPEIFDHDLFDAYCLEILERNHQEVFLPRIKELLIPDSPLFISGLSTAISYRVDSSLVTHDLSQIIELYQRVNQAGWDDLFTGQFILTYSDYYLETPALQAGTGKHFLQNTLGICGLKRNLKSQAKNAIRHKKFLAANEDELQVKRKFGSYLFIIFGLTNFLIFSVVYRSLIDFRRNISRAIKKPHGFFMDLQERRLITYGQSFFLMIVMSINGAVMMGGILYFFRNNFYMDYLLSLMFPHENIKMLACQLFWEPLYLIPILTVLIMIIFILFGFPVRALSFFRQPKVRARQAIAVSTWAGTPFLILLPFGMFFYSLLLVLNSYWILFAVLLYFHVWYFVRWMTGTRVMTALSYARVFLFVFFIFGVGTGGLVYYLESKIALLSHLDYLLRLFYFYV